MHITVTALEMKYKKPTTEVLQPQYYPEKETELWETLWKEKVSSFSAYGIQEARDVP